MHLLSCYLITEFKLIFAIVSTPVSLNSNNPRPWIFSLSKDLLPKPTFTLQRAVLAQEKGASIVNLPLFLYKNMGFPCTRLPFVIPLLWGMAGCPSTHLLTVCVAPSFLNMPLWTKGSYSYGACLEVGFGLLWKCYTDIRVCNPLAPSNSGTTLQSCQVIGNW